MKVIWIDKEEAHTLIRKKIIKTKVVLEIGTGIRPQTYFRPLIHICVEPYLTYIERLRQDIGFDPTYVFLNSTWDIAMKLLPEKSAAEISKPMKYFVICIVLFFDKTPKVV